jgi:hypothetical protein
MAVPKVRLPFSRFERPRLRYQQAREDLMTGEIQVSVHMTPLRRISGEDTGHVLGCSHISKTNLSQILEFLSSSQPHSDHGC